MEERQDAFLPCYIEIRNRDNIPIDATHKYTYRGLILSMTYLLPGALSSTI